MLTPGEEWAFDRKIHIAAKRDVGYLELNAFLRKQNLQKSDLLSAGLAIDRDGGFLDGYWNIDITELGQNYLESSSYFTIFVKPDRGDELAMLLQTKREANHAVDATPSSSQDDHLPWFVTWGVLAAVVYFWHDQFDGTPNTWAREVFVVFGGYYGLRFVFKNGIAGIGAQTRKLLVGALLICALFVVSTIFSTCSSTKTPACYGYRVGCFE